jgi:hypothetical protein
MVDERTIGAVFFYEKYLGGLLYRQNNNLGCFFGVICLFYFSIDFVGVRFSKVRAFMSSLEEGKKEEFSEK